MSDAPETAYRVLARKYRPQVFADLIGQEAMVRTLRNAFASGRIAHAFLLTGVRGTGKTTTARILARGLNCTGADGRGGVTIEPCGACATCRAIGEGRHVDVLEMDAATHTQVDRMRELLAAVPYRPAEARYKVYIVDEVHMLSTSAFNALLKTLEEPPAHVKFVFATTEVRKVPVTVLSRCQRFDLRRVEPEVMQAHLAAVAEREGARIAPEALALIVRAAEGSVRDALSLLDQAIAHGGGEAGVAGIRAMLGLADRGRILDLFDRVMRGDAAGALGELGAQYADGADPLAILRDLAEVTHWISVLKVSPETADDPSVAPEERSRGRDMAARLPLRALARAWQMLVKALEEVALAPSPMMAAEMAVIRLTHVADLPSPEELVRRFLSRTGPAAAVAPAPAPPEPRRGPQALVAGGGAVARAAAPASPPPAPVAPAPQARAEPASLGEVVQLLREARELPLVLALESQARLVRFEPGLIEIAPEPGAPPALGPDLARRMQALTGRRWTVSLVSGGGGATIAETRAAGRAALEARARAHPLVQAALAAFPGAEIREVRPREALAPPPPPDYGQPDGGEWDPIDPFGEEM